MATYKTITLPPAGIARGIMLAALHAESAVVYQRADGTVIESRESWPDGTPGLTPTPSPVPGTWMRLTPSP